MSVPENSSATHQPEQKLLGIRTPYALSYSAAKMSAPCRSHSPLSTPRISAPALTMPTPCLFHRLARRLASAISSWPYIVLLALLLPHASAAQTQESLRVLAWPGYADPDVVRAFEKRYGVHVEVTTVDSDDVLWERLRANHGGDFDVFAINTAELSRAIDEDLAQPLDVADIPNTRQQLPRFRDLSALPGVVRQGRVYAIPYTYGEMGLIYDRRRVSEPPTSLTALWNPRYQGQVLAYDGASHSFSLAALSLGIPTPFHLGEGELRKAVDRLLALRRNVRAFYTSPEESLELFQQNRIALMLANYGPQQLTLLQKAGLDVGYVIPREGTLAWLDCWAVSRNARNRLLAEQWIDYTLEAAVSGALTTRQGLANTLQEPRHFPPGARLIWLEPVENANRRTTLWRRIVAGDLPERF